MLDIIIVTTNNKKDLSQTLSSIAIQTKKDNSKIYLLINSKNSNYKKIDLFKEYLDLKIIKIENNINELSFSKNSAIKKATNKYLLFMNARD